MSCPSSTLVKGASETCTATYTVTQADVDAGSVTNTATVSGTYKGTTATSTASTVTVPASNATSSLGVVASTSAQSYGHAGENIPYSYDVTDTGTTSLSNIAVTDSVTNANGDITPLTVTCPGGSIAPGDHATCTAAYTVTQTDIDIVGSHCSSVPAFCYGQLGDSATATATNPASAVIGPSDPSFGGDHLQHRRLGLGVRHRDVELDRVHRCQPDHPPDLPGHQHRDDLAQHHRHRRHRRWQPGGSGESCTFDAPLSGSFTLDDGTLAGTLPPGATVTCTSSWTTTSTDVSNAFVVDSTTVTGTDLANGYQWTNTGGTYVPYIGG